MGFDPLLAEAVATAGAVLGVVTETVFAEARAAAHIASSDCETLRRFIGQPANVISSLAMSAVGYWMVMLARDWGDSRRQRSLAMVGMALVATGIGSAAFHGPGGWLAHVVHDVTITALPLAAAAAMESDRRRVDVGWWFAIPMTVTVIARAVTVDSHYPLTAGAFIWLAFSAYRRWRQGGVDLRWIGAAGASLVAARVIFALSRTGQTFCTPDSLIQGHAVWHLLIALSVVLVAKGLSLLPSADSDQMDSDQLDRDQMDSDQLDN